MIFSQQLVTLVGIKYIIISSRLSKSNYLVVEKFFIRQDLQIIQTTLIYPSFWEFYQGNFIIFEDLKQQARQCDLRRRPNINGPQ